MSITGWGRRALCLLSCVGMAGCRIEQRVDRAAVRDEPLAESQFIRPWGDSLPPSGVRSGTLVWAWRVSGTVPGAVPERLVEGGAAAETRQALENLLSVLRAAGGGLRDVAQCSLFLADSADLPAARAAYAELFPSGPTRTAVVLDGLALEARVELECTAVLSAEP